MGQEVAGRRGLAEGAFPKVQLCLDTGTTAEEDVSALLPAWAHGGDREEQE
jgi:hypothetical protein